MWRTIFIYWIRKCLFCVRWWHLAFWRDDFSAIYSKRNLICRVLHLCSNQLTLMKRLNRIQRQLELPSDVSVKEKSKGVRTPTYVRYMIYVKMQSGVFKVHTACPLRHSLFTHHWSRFSIHHTHNVFTHLQMELVMFTVFPLELLLGCVFCIFWNRGKAKWPQCSINTFVASQMPDCKSSFVFL